MEKVSIIIPVYNGEQYLAECLESILKQDYSCFEVIAINDGSTDQTLSILETYKEKFANFILISKKNEGVSVARNKGLSLATGDFIYFCDADDVLKPGALRKMVEKIKEADLLTFGYEEMYLDKSIPKGYLENKTIRTKDALERIVALQSSFEGYLWNKLFKRSIIKENRLQFDTHVTFCEDLLFCIQYLFHCEKINTRKEILYSYRMCKKGASKSFQIEKYTSLFLTYDKIIDLLEKRNIQNVIFLKFHYLYEYYYYQKNFSSSPISFTFPTTANYKQVLQSPMLSFAQKRSLFLAKHFPFLLHIRHQRKREKQKFYE